MSYAKAKADYAKKGGAVALLDLSACLWCKDPTPHGVLAMYGARCSHCYARYCRAGSAVQAPSFDQAGFIDTPTQRDMRKRIRGKLRPLALPGVPALPEPDAVDLVETSRRRVEAYAKQHGIQL